MKECGNFGRVSGGGGSRKEGMHVPKPTRGETGSANANKNLYTTRGNDHQWLEKAREEKIVSDAAQQSSKRRDVVWARQGFTEEGTPCPEEDGRAQALGNLNQT